MAAPLNEGFWKITYMYIRVLFNSMLLSLGREKILPVRGLTFIYISMITLSLASHRLNGFSCNKQWHCHHLISNIICMAGKCFPVTKTPLGTPVHTTNGENYMKMKLIKHIPRAGSSTGGLYISLCSHNYICANLTNSECRE